MRWLFLDIVYLLLLGARFCLRNSAFSNCFSDPSFVLQLILQFSNFLLLQFSEFELANLAILGLANIATFNTWNLLILQFWNLILWPSSLWDSSFFSLPNGWIVNWPWDCWWWCVFFCFLGTSDFALNILFVGKELYPHHLTLWLNLLYPVLHSHCKQKCWDLIICGSFEIWVCKLFWWNLQMLCPSPCGGENLWCVVNERVVVSPRLGFASCGGISLLPFCLSSPCPASYEFSSWSSHENILWTSLTVVATYDLLVYQSYDLSILLHGH